MGIMGLDRSKVLERAQALCCRYKKESSAGSWYITHCGIIKVAGVIGLKRGYTSLTEARRKQFRDACLDLVVGDREAMNCFLDAYN
jgi:hypothetical protein